MRFAFRMLTVVWLGLAAFISSAQTEAKTPVSLNSPLYGFTAFPYELSQEAVETVPELIAPASNLFAIHIDGPCIPWQESISDDPFPAWIADDWDAIIERIPAGHTVYVAITPTQTDRVSMVEQCGESESVPGDMPDSLVGLSYDDPAIISAYIAYAERVIEQFDPAFVNLAIEITEMSLISPETWEEFETLYLQTLGELRGSNSMIEFGLEVVLQSLMLERVGDQVKTAVDASDYMGISFYPYGGEYGEAVGAPGLPEPPEQWLDPLAFARAYTDIPLAMCETGYTTANITLPVNADFDLHFNGDEELQSAFTRDLVEITTSDDYLFVVWFVPVDYPRLLDQMGAELDNPAWIWVYSGLWAGPGEPKPALQEWLKFADR